MKYLLVMRILGFLAFGLGFVLNYVIAKRKFNRRTMTGMEGFKSYERAWLIPFIERVVRILAILLIIGGILLIIITFV